MDRARPGPALRVVRDRVRRRVHDHLPDLDVHHRHRAPTPCSSARATSASCTSTGDDATAAILDRGHGRRVHPGRQRLRQRPAHRVHQLLHAVVGPALDQEPHPADHRQPRLRQRLQQRRRLLRLLQRRRPGQRPRGSPQHRLLQLRRRARHGTSWSSTASAATRASACTAGSPQETWLRADLARQQHQERDRDDPPAALQLGRQQRQHRRSARCGRTSYDYGVELLLVGPRPRLRAVRPAERDRRSRRRPRRGPDGRRQRRRQRDRRRPRSRPTAWSATSPRSACSSSPSTPRATTGSCSRSRAQTFTDSGSQAVHDGTNTAPVVGHASRSAPASATTGSLLTASVTSHDADADTLTTAYQWTRNGIDIAGATGADAQPRDRRQRRPGRRHPGPGHRQRRHRHQQPPSPAARSPSATPPRPPPSASARRARRPIRP